MIENQALSEHFSLYELTQTSHSELQDENRILDNQQIVKGKMLAGLMEQVRAILTVPILVHSAWRCLKLNRVIGSSDISQHAKFEACDFSAKGMDLAQAFKLLRQAAHEGKIKFGQLIFEKASRSYGTTEWIHISMAEPYRDKERCGQVLTMNDGKYEIIETV